MGTDVDTAELLAGRVAIVSGVGPGLGRAIALALARAGADVGLGARRAAPLERVAAEIEDLGRRSCAVPTDVTDPDQCRRLTDTVASELGRLDALVNNAFAEEDWHEPFDGFDPARWRAPMAVNCLGSLTLTQAALPHLRGRGGAVVMISTLSVKNPIPLLAGYAASKRALTDASRVLADELRPGQHPGQLRRARSHRRARPRRVPRVERRTATRDARDDRGGDRRAERPAAHRHTGGDRADGGLLRQRPGPRAHRPESRRELRPHAQLMLLSGRVAVVAGVAGLGPTRRDGHGLRGRGPRAR